MNDEISLLHQKLNKLQDQYEEIYQYSGIILEDLNSQMTLPQTFETIYNNNQRLLDYFKEPNE